jgi:hypothetical protein
VNFKGFMADNAQANWNAVRKIYGVGDPSLPMVGRGRICLFQWSQNLDKVTQKYIKTSLQFQHKQLQSYLFNMTRLGNEKKIVLSRCHIFNNMTNWTWLSQ